MCLFYCISAIPRAQPVIQCRYSQQPIDWTRHGVQITDQLSAGTVNTLQTAADLNCSKHPVRTAQKTHFVSVIKTRQITLYREIIAVCSVIHIKHINTLLWQNVVFLHVKLLVHLVTTGL
jgi:hypothetical protein